MAPERSDRTVARDAKEYEGLTKFRPNYLVIDDAHTVSQPGDGFRPIYADLVAVRKQVG